MSRRPGERVSPEGLVQGLDMPASRLLAALPLPLQWGPGTGSVASRGLPRPQPCATSAGPLLHLESAHPTVSAHLWPFAKSHPGEGC